MVALLLAVIYLSFISLGLPDSLIGSGWPVMHVQLGVPISYMGFVTMIISGGTIASSLCSDFLTKKLGTWLVTAVSILLTALSLFGFSCATQFWHLCAIAVPYGLGAGAIDAALNNYVALHFESRHMNWLHSFWGVGTMISPYIMGACLSGALGWTGGYATVSVIQIVIAVIAFCSFPLWRRKSACEQEEEKAKPLPLGQTLRIKGVFFVMIAFCAYCALEQTAMVWASSYLVQYRSISEETAATFGSLFFIGITAGRFACGFVSDKLGDRTLIRIGLCVIAVGIVLLGLPVQTDILALVGFVVIGIGCAPVYPAIIHSTPVNFGKENSQAIIGVQMASAYIGTLFAPPLFGLIAQYINIAWLPVYLAAFALFTFLMTELLNKKKK